MVVGGEIDWRIFLKRKSKRPVLTCNTHSQCIRHRGITTLSLQVEMLDHPFQLLNFFLLQFLFRLQGNIFLSRLLSGLFDLINLVF